MNFFPYITQKCKLKSINHSKECTVHCTPPFKSLILKTCTRFNCYPGVEGIKIRCCDYVQYWCGVSPDVLPFLGLSLDFFFSGAFSAAAASSIAPSCCASSRFFFFFFSVLSFWVASGVSPSAAHHSYCEPSLFMSTQTSISLWAP